MGVAGSCETGRFGGRSSWPFFYALIRQPRSRYPDAMANNASLERMAEARKRADRLKTAEAVHQMRLAGATYTRIARTLKLTGQNAAQLHREHLQLLQELDELGAASDSKRLTDQRYEMLLNVVWQAAMAGDMTAVKECRAILDSISQRESRATMMVSREDPDGTKMTIIADGSTDDYAAALRRMSV